MVRTTQNTTINRTFGTSQVRTGLNRGIVRMTSLIDRIRFQLAKLCALHGKRHASSWLPLPLAEPTCGASGVFGSYLDGQVATLRA